MLPTLTSWHPNPCGERVFCLAHALGCRSSPALSGDFRVVAPCSGLSVQLGGREFSGCDLNQSPAQTAILLQVTVFGHVCAV